MGALEHLVRISKTRAYGKLNKFESFRFKKVEEVHACVRTIGHLSDQGECLRVLRSIDAAITVSCCLDKGERDEKGLRLDKRDASGNHSNWRISNFSIDLFERITQRLRAGPRFFPHDTIRSQTACFRRQSRALTLHFTLKFGQEIDGGLPAAFK